MRKNENWLRKLYIYTYIYMYMFNGIYITILYYVRVSIATYYKL